MHDIQDAPVPLNLPLDRARANGLRHSSRVVSRMPEWLRAAVENFSNEQQVTFVTTILAAFKTLLFRMTEAEDILVGVFHDGSGGSGEPMSGGSASVSTNLSGDPPFRDLLQRVQTGLIQETLRPKTSAEFSDEAACQATLVVRQNVLAEATGNWASNSDLTLIVPSRADDSRLWLEFDSDLFDEETMLELLDSYCMLLQGIVNDSSRPLSSLPLLSEAQRKQVLFGFNDTSTEYPRQSTIPALFEEQVERSPDSIAVAFQGSRLTYRELNVRANRVANHLRRLGVERETLVGICLERSLEAVVGTLAILKAGGAYVPLDPRYPADRLLLIMKDTATGVLLTTSEQIELLPEYSGHLVLLDEPLEGEQASDSLNLSPLSQADDVCYVMYTSGSTGRPKGTRIVHRGVVRLVCGTDYLEIDSEDVFLQFASLSFDAATFEIWAPLLNGARLEIPPPGLLSLDDLGRVICDRGVTTLWLTAGLFHQMVDYRVDQLILVRQLLVGGDIISPTHAREFLNRANGSRLINGYGPTENTTFTCCYPMDRPQDVGPTVSIGRPIANTQVYVLDEHREPVPIGVPGELYIGGDGLARDYLNDPVLTDERYIGNPFQRDDADPDARLYRTGDKVRWHWTGSLEFLGRLDRQVKIRGYRVELGEIEEALRQHPEVADAAVMVDQYSHEKRLIAYFTSRAEEAGLISTLREYLSDELPNFMIPSRFVALDKFPLTANGKVDRQALPAPDETVRHSHEQPYVAPRSEFESVLTEIWQDVLGLDRIGVHDSFVALGGDSLRAMEIVVLAHKKLHVRTTPASLFETPTIAKLAEAFEKLLSIQAPLEIPQADRSKSLELSSAQLGLWFHNRYHLDDRSYNILLGYRLRGPVDAPLLERCFQSVVNRHEILRTTYEESQEGPIQRVWPRQEFRLEQTDLSDLPASVRTAERDSWIAQIVRRPFDLTSGPLMRAYLVRLSREEYLLLLAVHHIAFDGWSEGVLFREICQLYRVERTGRVSPLPPLPIQYADYAAWQRQAMQGEQFEADLAYWKQQLSGAPPLLQLPWDRPRPARQTFAGRTLFNCVPRGVLSRLEQFSKQEDATLYMTLMSAFKIVLYRLSHQDDLVVGLPVANRHHTDIENLIGIFVNLVALRTNLAGDPTYRELLHRVRTATLEAFAHQDVPFERLVNELKTSRNPSYSNVFQAVLVFHNASASAVALPGLEVSRLEIDSGTSKFDLAITAVESGEGLELWCEYNTDLFDEATIATMLKSYTDVLASFAENPDQRVDLANGQETQPPQRPRPEVESSNGIEPRTPLEHQLAEVWRRLLGVSHIGIHDNFFHVGGHSLLATALAVEFEKNWDRQIPIAELFESNTIAMQASLIDTLPRKHVGARLIPLHVEQDKPAIILLPGAGGQAFTFSDLVKQSYGRGSIYSIQIEADSTKTGQPSMEQLADECVALIQKSKLPEPYHLAGYSFGGILAYEVARKLELAGTCVGVVGIIDTGASHHKRMSLGMRCKCLVLFARNLPNWLSSNLRNSQQLSASIRRRTSLLSRRLRSLVTRQKYEAIPEDIWDMSHKSTMERQNFQDHLRAFFSYVPGPYRGRITLFRAKVRPLFHSLEHDLGWSNIDIGGIDIHHFQADHGSILSDAGQEVAEHLLREIDHVG